MYEYKAIVTGVYDGDTITVDIDLGFGILLKQQKIRLLYIDTPEIRGDERNEGLISRDRVRDLILDKEIIIRTEKDSKGKYGRWLGEIFYDGNDISLNEQLVSEGLAQKINY